jgi:hypothetical protein
MTDILTYCDVNTCEDCPRYGDDCDGDKRVEHTDTISRADAIKAVASITMSIHLSDVICDKLLALPSAELVLQTPQTYGKSINPSADAEQTVYCMDCAKSAPLDEHGALWYCKAHDRTTLRHSYCNNGERKGGDDE